MGLRHRELAVEGVQFHPESILTVGGHDLLRNFLAQADARPPLAAGSRRRHSAASAAGAAVPARWSTWCSWSTSWWWAALDTLW